jgi:hypothetical protein
MALDDNTLKSALLAIYNEARNSPMTDELFAEKMAKAIDDQIKTAEVKAGISVDGGTASGGNLVDCKTSGKGMIE